jgi:hypothetical protein
MSAESVTSANVADLERDVQKRSAVFKKELGLFDLVLTQVVFVVGTIWVGWAAKLGSDQNVFWLLAMFLFYLPLAGAVIFLNRLMPLEGGLYLWLKIACVSGFLVSLVYIGFTIVPIISVESRFVFAAKIIAVVLLANGLGIAIFLLGSWRQSGRQTDVKLAAATD